MTRHLIPLASRLVTFATLVNRLAVNRLAVNRLAILVNLPIPALFTRQVTRQFTPMQFTPKVWLVEAQFLMITDTAFLLLLFLFLFIWLDNHLICALFRLVTGLFPQYPTLVIFYFVTRVRNFLSWMILWPRVDLTLGVECVVPVLLE